MKTAKAIERYFTVALYLLVLTGFGALASTGGLDLPAVTLVGLALILRGYQLVTRREPIISERWTNILTLVYVFIYLVDYSFVSRGFLGATVHLALFVMVVRLFSLRGTRDHYMLAALSFGMVLAASVLTVGSVFLFSFAIFLLVAIITFVLMEMRHSLSEDLALSHDPGSHDPRSDDSRSVASGTGIARVDSNRRMAHALLAIAPALMLMVLAGRRYIPPGVHPPIISFAIALAISTWSLLSIGFFIASIVPTARFAQPIGAVVLYPMVGFSGLFVPVASFPPAFRVLAHLSPMNFAVNLLQGIWVGDPWSAHLVDVGALVVFFLLFTALSTKTFRWE